MRDTIYTIPITEVFEPKCGCPLCSLRQSLETRWVEYITGAAMMEPDIRMETNRLGFCSRHFDGMLAQRNRLSVALILQSHLEHLDAGLDKGGGRAPSLFVRKRGDEGLKATCFVCDKIDTEFARIADNLMVHWARDADFRALYADQEYLCLPHYRTMTGAAQDKLKSRQLSEFLEVSALLVRRRLRELRQDIDSFCQLFDHRNAGSQRPEEHIATSIERTIAFLSARPLPADDSPDRS